MSSAEKVSVATSREELEAIWRFRYEVYIEELKRDYPDVDHENRWYRDADDESEHAINLYVGSLDNIIGIQRVLVWPAGKIPANYYELFSMEMFPGIEHAVIAEAGRLMIRPSARGHNVFPVLVNGMQEIWRQHGVELCFLYCAPGLVKHYRKTLKARPYDGRLIPAGSIMGIPMVILTAEEQIVEPCDKPLEKPTGSSEQEANQGFVLSRITRVLEGDSVPVKLDEAVIWELFQHQLLEDESATPAFLNSLSEETAKRLTSSGFILELSPGDVITKTGTKEREMYVILDGIFEVIAQEKRLAILEKGDLFGEIAFFSETGERCASVRAVTKGEVLVLRRNFLKELTRTDPEAGFQILTNMGTVMADRIVSLNQALLAAGCD